MNDRDIEAIQKEIYDKMKVYKAYPLPSCKGLELTDVKIALDKSRGDGKPFIRFLECGEYLKDFVLSDASFGSQRNLKEIKSFEDMTQENLFYYVYWRTQIRKGLYEPVKKDFVYIYISELINLIGVNPQEGLDKLFFLWHHWDESKDYEFFKLIKDFCIMHSIEPFEKVATRFKGHFQGVTCFEDRIYNGDFKNTLIFFDEISAQHKIIGSTFYNSEKGKFVDEAFEKVMEGVTEYYLLKGLEFNKILFTKHTKEYIPFAGNSLVDVNVPIKDYTVSQNERYYTQDNTLYVDKLFINKEHTRVISFILKHIESRVRELLGEQPLKMYKMKIYQDRNLEKLIDQNELVKVIYGAVDSTLNKELDKSNREIEESSIEEVLNKMKRLSITKDGLVYGADLFIKQVKFMEDFEYNQEEEIHSFPISFPSYSHMTNSLLKSYYSWRSKIRKGVYGYADIGYIKLYLNETLLLSNCKDEKDAILKLTEFWKGMRKIVGIDELMEDTIIEFYIQRGMDIPFSEIWGMCPEEYISDNELIEEISRGDYSNIYDYFNRRIKIVCSKEAREVLKKVLPNAIERAEMFLRNEAKFPIKELLLGKYDKKVYKSHHGYVYDKDNCRYKEEVTLLGNVKFTYEKDILYLHSYEFEDTEASFVKYIVSLIIKAVKNYRRGDFSIIPFDKIFGGFDAYSKYAEIVESMKFVELITEDVKEIYKDRKYNSVEYLPSTKYGNKEIFYDPYMTKGVERILFSVDFMQYSDKEKMYEYIQEVTDEIIFCVPYSQYRLTHIRFYIQALLIEGMEDNTEHLQELRGGWSSNKQGYGFANYLSFLFYLQWRSNVREGRYNKASSYTVVKYISELINLIGVSDPEELMDKLIHFWIHFREVNDSIDDVMESAVRDTYVYYNLDKPYSHYTKLFPKDLYSVSRLYEIYEGNYEYASMFILEKSPYRAKESAFGKSENGYLIEECLPNVLKRLDELFMEHGLSLATFLLGRKVKERYNLFQKFHFMELRTYKNVVLLNDHEVFEWDSDGYLFRTGNGFGWVSAEISGIIVKLTEIALRKALSFRTGLKSPLETTKKTSLEVVYLISVIGEENINAGVFQAVSEVCYEKGIFIKDHEIAKHAPKVNKVEIDFSKLDDIRRVASELTEKLVIEDEMENTRFEIEEEEEILTNRENYGTIEDDPYGAFVSFLNDIQKRILTAIVSGENINTIARDLMIMPEVIIEEINEIALEITGDTVIDTDDTIIEEYLDCIERVLGG